jgi:dienelactone hydrolase
MHKESMKRIALTLAFAFASTVTAGAQTPPPQPALPANCSAVTGPIVGTICVPKDAGKHPAMILLGGSDGGDSMRQAAAMFAAKGYVAASVAYFGLPGLPASLVDVPVETVGRAIEALQGRGDVDAARIGILGISRGGEFALLAAATYPQIKAVIGISPSPIAYMGLGSDGIPTGCAWSRGGTPLPCVPADALVGQAVGAEFMQGKPIVLEPLYEASRKANPAVTQAAFFPLERIDGPLLCLSGAADVMWNAAEQCVLATAYLSAHHHAYADRAIAYPNAGHLFLWAMHGPSSAFNQVKDGPVTLAFGGTPAGDAAASPAAWAAIWSFLAKRLGQQ